VPVSAGAERDVDYRRCRGLGAGRSQSASASARPWSHARRRRLPQQCSALPPSNPLRTSKCRRAMPCHAPAFLVRQRKSTGSRRAAAQARWPVHLSRRGCATRGTGQSFSFPSGGGGGARLARHTERRRTQSQGHPPRPESTAIIPNTSLSSTAPHATPVPPRPPRFAPTTRAAIYTTTDRRTQSVSAPTMTTAGAATAASSSALPFLLLLLLLPQLAAAANVTYDHRSLIIDGRRRLLISASIHYPRSVPAVSWGLNSSPRSPLHHSLSLARAHARTALTLLHPWPRRCGPSWWPTPRPAAPTASRPTCSGTATRPPRARFARRFECRSANILCTR
jgi:hypothetical protein